MEFDPEEYCFQVFPDEQFDDFHGPDKFAVYGLQERFVEAQRISWRDLCLGDGRMLVTIRESVLESDQGIVAIFAHECIEVEALRKRLDKRRTVSVSELYYLTADGMRSNLHWTAWIEANQLVIKNFGESK